jgi:hypothetical protein
MGRLSVEPVDEALRVEGHQARLRIPLERDRSLRDRPRRHAPHATPALEPHRTALERFGVAHGMAP